MAFLGDESVWAAAASECANEQNQFWTYHDVLFTHTAARLAGPSL
jgi:protein-disulfide isomerase